MTLVPINTNANKIPALLDIHCYYISVMMAFSLNIYQIILQNKILRFQIYT